MTKPILFFTLLAVPALAGAVPSHVGTPRPAALFNAAELNNLARLDERSQPARVRRMQTEIALLRDQVDRMKLDRLIDTVLTGSKTPAARLYR